jgi:phage RecT family recombinase
MSQDLAVIEHTLLKLEPRFAQVLSATGIAPERIIRTVMVSLERLPALLDCSQQSIINAAMSAACLGIEVDGVTGQGFLIPFAGRAQLVIGYKGMNTMAARSGFTVNAGLVREGDSFDYQLGSGGFVRHKPLLGNKGKIIAAWAIASAPGRSDIIVPPLSIDELMAVKAKSPGARKADSPWNDPAIGFPAMCEKTAKRRLGRALPLNVMVLGAAMDEAHEERGKYAYIHPDKGLVIDGEATPVAQPGTGAPNLERPRFAIALSDGSERSFPTAEQWQGFVRQAAAKIRDAGDLDAFDERNRDSFAAVQRFDAGAAMAAIAVLRERRIELTKGAQNE